MLIVICSKISPPAQQQNQCPSIVLIQGEMCHLLNSTSIVQQFLFQDILSEIWSGPSTALTFKIL